MSSVMDTWAQATQDAIRACGPRMEETVERRLNEIETSLYPAHVASVNCYLQGLFSGAALGKALANDVAHDAMLRTIHHARDRLTWLTGQTPDVVKATATLVGRMH